jgi:hypothetical protein
MSKEEMKLALELLAVATFHSPELQKKRAEVIEAGLEALANHCEDNLNMVQQEQGEPVALDEYDAGLLNDFGGGNVEWWQDYLRAELGRAYEHYQSQMPTQPAQEQGEPVAWNDGVLEGVMREREYWLKKQQRKPLTHEQRLDLHTAFEPHKSKWNAQSILIDMVEAAHGIKE